MTQTLEQAYTELCEAYCRHADAGAAEEFAKLFSPDGVFDRLGTLFQGREAIRANLAARPAEVWTRHRCGNYAAKPGTDEVHATGKADLELQRGRKGEEAMETLRGHYEDALVRTAEGWRFGRRVVRLQS